MLMLNFSAITHRQLLLLLALVSGAVLAGAFIGQYGFDLHPCHLCLLQRYPHAVVVIVGVVAAWRLKNTTIQRYLLLFAAVVLLVGMGIASYHAGVEVGLFKAPDGCSAEAGTGQSLEELRAQIAGAALVSCSQAMAYIFGVSMAVWNALVSLGMVGVIACYLRKKSHDAPR